MVQRSEEAMLSGSSRCSTAVTSTARDGGSSDSFVSSLGRVLAHLVSVQTGCETPVEVTASGGNLTVFHAVREPNVSIQDYLFRIARYFLCSPECFVMALIYVDRIVRRHSDFIVCKLNVHRLIVTSMMLSVKFFDDVYYSNAYYAKVGGVRGSEMNVLEAHFLRLLDWDLFVKPEEFEAYKHNVLNAFTATETKQASPVIVPSKFDFNDHGYDGFDNSIISKFPTQNRTSPKPDMFTSSPY
jgi:hypothetical protein